MKAILGIIFAAVLMLGVPVAQAQHGGHGTKGNNGGQHAGQHGGQKGGTRGRDRGGERGVDRGHGRNEGRRIDGTYRNRYFGRPNHVYCGFYGRPTFLFGGIWFGVDTWPSFWLSTDFVYVDYVDGDYFLVDERFGGPEGRIAIIIE